ncbi:MAG: UDP-N-acetylmuramoyl-tripeptide--D-alanyl-D-alanine ligase [Spirulinaceae cyanobacterium]
MSCQLSLAELNNILASEVLNFSPANSTQKVLGITTDTRTLKSGEVFLALKGENFDGHSFVKTALHKGARALILNQNCALELSAKVPLFYVEDTLATYQKIARVWRDRFDIPVVGITGSVGKTTTKELIAAILSTQGQVLKSQANYNNEIGVPKTLLELAGEDRFAVIEMAMRGLGQIAELTQTAHPTIGVITNVGTAHIGLLGSKAAIAQAKCELLAEMPNTSVAVLNYDNQLLMDTASQVWQGETITFGLTGGDIQGKLLNPQTMLVDGMELPLPLSGRHNALNYLAALAVAKILNIDWSSFAQSLTVNLPQGRAQRYELPQDVVILDETYNAGTESMIAALHLLKETPGKRQIAILGTMKELGEQSSQLHQKVGLKVQELALDYLLILKDDPEAQAIAEGVQNIPTQCFTTHQELNEALQQLIQPGDRLLFKASNSVGLNKVVEKFKEDWLRKLQKQDANG